MTQKRRLGKRTLLPGILEDCNLDGSFVGSGYSLMEHELDNVDKR